jgi:guanylate kinase
MSETREKLLFTPNVKRRGLLLVVSGPSGSGKGTVLSSLFERRNNLFYSVSATTRSPRPGEIDGREYYFLTRQEFERKIDDGGMLEHACYCDNYYGTPRSAVEEQCNNGIDVILEIEVQGAMQVKKAWPDCVTIFIEPPSPQELERRLRGRGTESDEVIKNRLNTAMQEINHVREYDYIVVNDEVEEAAAKIDCIMAAEKCKASRFEN